MVKVITPQHHLLRISTFVVGFILCADALLLLSMKKIHLGIILPLLIGLYFCTYSIFFNTIQRKLKDHPKVLQLYKIFKILFIFWVVSVFAFFLFLTIKSNHQSPIPAVKAIIVLGSGIENGKPSATLANRLDRAAELAKQQPQAYIVLTGGLDFREQHTEAAVMAKYLQQTYNLNSKRMILEDQSTSTELNLQNSQKLLKPYQIGLNSPIAIVTSDFHTIRAQAIARKQGYLQTYPVGSPTPLLTRYNTWLREYFAYLSGWVLNEY